jgi:hypothetical protein
MSLSQRPDYVAIRFNDQLQLHEGELTLSSEIANSLR